MIGCYVHNRLMQLLPDGKTYKCPLCWRTAVVSELYTAEEVVCTGCGVTKTGNGEAIEPDEDGDILCGECHATKERTSILNWDVPDIPGAGAAYLYQFLY